MLQKACTACAKPECMNSVYIWLPFPRLVEYALYLSHAGRQACEGRGGVCKEHVCACSCGMFQYAALVKKSGCLRELMDQRRQFGRP
jgi:hypothetical protein